VGPKYISLGSYEKEATMSGDTVLSIVEAVTGGVSVTSRSMTAAEYLAFSLPAWIARIRFLQSYGMYAYIEELAASSITKSYVQAALSEMAAQEAAVVTAAADAAAVAAEGTLVAGAGTTAAAIVIPIIALVAVGLALGAPYYQARVDARNEGNASGFSKGYVCGLLKWSVHNTVNLFWDRAVQVNPYDEVIPSIQAKAHNSGLLKGRFAGIAQSDSVKKTYLRALHRLTTTSSAGWSARSDDWQEVMRARQVQLSYVIDLASAARRYGVFKVD
jgi:hypothetical protein